MGFRGNCQFVSSETSNPHLHIAAFKGVASLNIHDVKHSAERVIMDKMLNPPVAELTMDLVYFWFCSVVNSGQT